jgi:hypothetical protein
VYLKRPIQISKSETTVENPPLSENGVRRKPLDAMNVNR